MSTILFEQLARGQAPPHVPITVAQLHEMLEAGWLADGEPLELVDGVLVRKDRSAVGEDPMTHGKRHSTAVAMLRRLDRRLDEHGCHLRSQLPVSLSATSEPEPDGAVVRGRDDSYLDHHPSPEEVVAIIEAADRSLPFDRGAKLSLYAAAAIPLYVIVNLVDGQVEVHRQPDPAAERYVSRDVVTADERFDLPLPTGTLRVAARDLLPD